MEGFLTWKGLYTYKDTPTCGYPPIQIKKYFYFSRGVNKFNNILLL